MRHRKPVLLALILLYVLILCAGCSTETQEFPSIPSATIEPTPVQSAEVRPVITKFAPYEGTTTFSIKVGSGIKFAQPMSPRGLSRKDFTIEISDKSVVSVTEGSLQDGKYTTILVFTVKGISPGQATVRLVASDGKTTSQTLTFKVSPADTSRVVYITPTGERYHFSAACAGKNAIATTLSRAKASGVEPCKKCAR